MVTADRVPVLIGVGEEVERPGVPSLAREPVALMEAAILKAEADVGVSILAEIDSLEVVGQVTWRYADPVSLLAERLAITPVRRINESMGGETPIRLLHEAALRVQRGESQLCVVVGGEAVHARQKAKAAGVLLDWTPQASRADAVKVAGSRLRLSASSRALGVEQPIHIYPLYENAWQHAQGQSPRAAFDDSAQLWSEYAKVAAASPVAWVRSAPTAEQISAVGPDNRRIAWPYPKLMVANPNVNQAAAFIVTSLERARALGVSSDKIVHLWGGAAAQETEDFLDRDSYDHSTAQDAVLNGAVNLAGGDATRFDFAELYSCFPVVPKMALNTLGLRAGVLPTVTGGISFFGGPMNNYMSHAVCAMVRELRAHEGALGLLYGQGGVFNKHHAVVVSASPAPAPLSPDYSVQCAADALRRPTPLRIERYDGPASVETWTVIYDRDGNPKQGVVVARTNRDERLIARADPTDQETLDRLTDLSCSAIGTEGQVRTDVFGDLIWSCSPAPRYRPNPTFCEVERDGPITLVIINRPDAMNALHSAANAELAEVFDDFAVDPDQWIAILTGAGEKAFSAGNDLKYSAAAQARGEFVRVPLTGFAGLTNRFNLPKPVIAAVNGVAMGGGFEIALACDLVIASDNATFALPEPKVGLAALAGGLHRLPRQIGLKPAMGMILTGRAISAKEALALGVVNEVTTPDDLLPAAKRWATDILACSPMSIRASKAAVQKGLLESDIEGAIASQRLEPNMKALFRSRDLYEGPRAFAEKRKPRWEGR